MGERTCNACGSSDLVSISMVVDGRRLLFTACHACEAKWWDRDGEPVTLHSVIDIVASK